MKERYLSIMRMLVVALLDLLVMTACGGVALLARFGFVFSEVPKEQISTLLSFLAVEAVVTVTVFIFRRMYHYVWRSVSALDVADMILSVMMAFALSYLAARLLGVRLPTSVAFITLLSQLITMVGMRCALRFYGVFVHSLGRRGGERIMLIGAGEAGRMLLRELQRGDRVSGRVCCIIDDNPAKKGKQMDGVSIVGGREQIRERAQRHGITQIIFAIPSASAKDRQEILELCKMTGCRVKTLPGVYQLVSGEVSLANVKDVQLEDLLGRETVQLDTEMLSGFLGGKTVLVTGGGGSIGSELCRQIAQYHPKRLLVLDIYENNAYELEQELRRKHPALELHVEIASIRDKERIYEFFDRWRPEIVFHAAAHKHVPLMELCPEEAVKNNIFGTYHVVRAAEKFGTEKFVMISSDKAVNPTNVMGATKRFCEMILQSRQGSGTEFCAVRFGNVLGSSGSVVPLFQKQIESGGPITLTDRRVIRYFMTIPEASQLVLEAGAMATAGQIFVLDMGEPVKILTLAENLIRLSGLEPYKDIEIKEVGLRPGEKLFEELLMDRETLHKTAREKIFVEQQEAIDPAEIMADLQRLDVAVTDGSEPEEIIALLKRMISTYRSPEEVNARTAAEMEGEQLTISSLPGVGAVS